MATGKRKVRNGSPIIQFTDKPRLEMATKRKFNIAFIENRVPVTATDKSFYDLFTDLGSATLEYCYAIQENADLVMDLAIGERLLMNFNRNNNDSSGYIIRIK